MWYEIFKFELRYRLKRPETYIFFLFLFLFSLAGVDFVFNGVELGQVKKNAPLVIAKTMGVITGIFMMLASMIMGVPILRDFQYGTEPFLFVTPISKMDYLLGRFMGSFVILLGIFSGVLLGLMLGELMPWHLPDDYLPFTATPYIQAFLVISLPLLFFGSALFFTSGTLSKNMLVVYTQGIVFFMWFMLTKAIENEFLQSLLDPFSLTTLTYISKSWTVAEHHLGFIPFGGVLLYNKLLWVLLGLICLIIGYRKFSFHMLKSPPKKQKAGDILEAYGSFDRQIQLPTAVIVQDFKTKWVQLGYLSYFYFREITKRASFWAIVICGMLIVLVNSVSLGTVYGVDSYPKTYFIVEELQETSIYFFIILLVFYSAELIWSERGAKIDFIMDATAISDLVRLSGKYVALLGVYGILLFSLIITGICFQIGTGYHEFEPQVYFYGFFLEIFPFLALYTLLGFFIQVVVNHKFIGILVTVASLIGIVLLGVFGYDHDLYYFGGNPLPSYSDMNGYGHYLKPYLLNKIYWLLFGILLLLMASLVSVRGSAIGLLERLKASTIRWSRPLRRMSCLIGALFLIIGSFTFYNTNILNRYWPASKANRFRAAYEKTLKRFEYLPQPKITQVRLKMELYPKIRDYTVEGSYTLKNTQDSSIHEIHIQKAIEDDIRLSDVRFDHQVTLDDTYAEFDYYKYILQSPLRPGDSVRMNFVQTYRTRGFESGIRETRIVPNGTFLDNGSLPSLAYNNDYELRDASERKDHGLIPSPGKATREDQKELVNARSGSDSDGINFDIVIGTSIDQIAVAPGRLVNEWESNNRSYYQYEMQVPMINFYTMVSARYEVLKDMWAPTHDSLGSPVDLEIYYHKGHEYNLDRMMEAMHCAIDYCTANFAPYPYGQLRIMEFPRYAEFAQSYPTAVPFSESMGFVLDIDEEKDVDMVFYITAHEIAHQWWGLQVEAANVQGQHMILETLAQYSALMVLKQKYPEEKVQQFLNNEKERYNKERQSDSNREVPLALVGAQAYSYYRKGVINMHTLQEAIGEEKVNLALRRFIEDWKTEGGRLKSETKNYATTKELLRYFREVTPPEQLPLVHELFETVNTLE